MSDSLKTQTRRVLRIAIAFAPWVFAMYLYYWLDASGTWTSETAHRGKISVAILAAGMVLSLLVWSHFAKREPK